MGVADEGVRLNLELERASLCHLASPDRRFLKREKSEFYVCLIELILCYSSVQTDSGTLAGILVIRFGGKEGEMCFMLSLPYLVIDGEGYWQTLEYVYPHAGAAQ